MSITLGGYHVETKKTVGDLPIGADNILGTPPCEDVVDIANFQPKWKKIHEYTITDTAIFNPLLGVGGLWEIPSIFHQIGDDDVYADGDYEIVVDNITFSGGAPVSIIRNHISYTIGGNNWWHFVTNGLTVRMNENNCGGSYSNTSRGYNLHAESPNPFGVVVQISIRQLLRAQFEIDLCGGGVAQHVTTLKQKSDQIVIINNEGIEETVVSVYRDEVYDPVDLGELSRLPSTCLGYRVYYVSDIWSGAYNAPVDKTYWLDSGIYEAQINIPRAVTFPIPTFLDFKLFFNGLAYVFSQLSTESGLIEYTPFAPTFTGNTTLELWDGIGQELFSGEQYVSFKYDLNSYDCPCDECPVSCGEINVIFHQNCGNKHSLKFNLSIQEGQYDIKGETYMQGGELIRPITETQAKYEFVITEYSDETFLLLAQLITDNILIEVVDNIDAGNPTTLYYLDVENMTPKWNFNSKLGSLTLPVIKKNSIRTARRNCCN